MMKDIRKQEKGPIYGQKLYTVEPAYDDEMAAYGSQLSAPEGRLTVREYIVNEILLAGPMCAEDYSRGTPKPAVKRFIGFAERGAVRTRREFTHTLIDPVDEAPEGGDTAYTTRKAAETALLRLTKSTPKTGTAGPGRTATAHRAGRPSKRAI